jgi:hypothetical protein
MDQNNNWNTPPGNQSGTSSPSGFGTTSGTTGTTGSGISGTTGSGSSFGSTGSTSGSGNTGFGVNSASELSSNTGTGTGTCATCGQSLRGSAGLEQFLGRLGITDDMIDSLKTQFQNVDVDEYLNTARDYLKSGSNRATTYTKENPGKVAAGVATLALGAGLLYAALNRDRA